MSLTHAQHIERGSGIGGSDAYIACGFTAFNRTPVSLWAEKTGRKQRDEIPEQARERVDIGSRIEDLIADLYQDRMGVSVRRRHDAYRHPEHDFMLCHVDRIVEKKPWLTEFKNVDGMVFNMSDDWGEPGTDQVPLNYLFQCQHSLAVTGRERCDLAALVGGNRLVVYHIEADLEFQKMIYRCERAFWDCVVNETPPEPMTAQDITHLFPEDSALTPKIATYEIFRAVEKYKFHRAQVKKHTDEKDELGLEIKAFMEDAGVLIDVNGMELATFKKNKDSTATDWESAFSNLLAIAGVSDEIRDKVIKHHTTTKPGNRPLLTKSGEKPYGG